VEEETEKRRGGDGKEETREGYWSKVERANVEAAEEK